MDSSPHDGTVDMEGTKEDYARGGEGVWFRQPVGDGRAILLGNYTGPSGDV